MGLIDTHAHVWDETCRLVAGTAYHPTGTAPYERLRELWSEHGVSAGVLVQPSFLGSENVYLLSALRREPDRLRGIIIADPNRDLAVIDELHHAGVRGFRFNLISGPPLPDFSARVWRAFVRETRARGWHVVVAAQARLLARSLPALSGLNLPIVVDHFGLPDPGWGGACAVWQGALADPGLEERLWVKLSAPYRLGGRQAGDLLPFLLDTIGPARLIWGSDWPWTRHEAGRSFHESVSRPLEPVPDRLRGSIAEDNAARLYGFPPS